MPKPLGKSCWEQKKRRTGMDGSPPGHFRVEPTSFTCLPSPRPFFPSFFSRPSARPAHASSPVDGLAVITAVDQHQQAIMCAGKRALARISTGSSVFSGFVDNTTVVSVSHGLGPTTPKEVFLETEMTSGSAFIAYRNASKDIAIFKTTFVNATITPLPIADPSAVMVGSSVMALGFPSQGGALSVGNISSEGLTASDPENGLYDDVGMAQLAIWPGNSGGPVMNMSGEVVGMVVGSLASDTGKSFVHALFAKCSSIRDAYYRAAQPTIRRLTERC